MAHTRRELDNLYERGFHKTRIADINVLVVITIAEF